MSTQRFSTDGLDFPPSAPTSCDPADANYCPEWHGVIDKLNLTCVVVQMSRCQKAFEFAGGIEETIAARMEYARLAFYDSSQFNPHVRHFLYVPTNKLLKALKYLKAGLTSAGLLEISAIGYFDATEKIWREFHPGVEKQK